MYRYLYNGIDTTSWLLTILFETLKLEINKEGCDRMNFIN